MPLLDGQPAPETSRNSCPVPGQDRVPQDPQLPPIDGGNLGTGLGLLRPELLTQLISAVVAGVALIARAMFSGQQDPSDGTSGGGGDLAGSSSSKKQREVVHSLPWGASCGGSSGGSAGGSGVESPLPSVDIAMPLGDHLPQATREKILQGEYVDLFSILYHKVEKNDKDLLDDKEKEILRKRKIEQMWTNWLSGYLVYAWVIVQEHPDRGPALFQYMDIIYKVYLNFASDCWLQYDEDFRIRANSKPALPWDQVHSGLWLQTMTVNKVLSGERAHSGHLVQRSGVSQTVPR